MAFTFGAAAPAPAGGLFGGTPAAAPAGGLFGAVPAPAPAAGGSLFGGAPAAAPAGGLVSRATRRTLHYHTLACLSLIILRCSNSRTDSLQQHRHPRRAVRSSAVLVSVSAQLLRHLHQPPEASSAKHQRQRRLEASLARRQRPRQPEEASSAAQVRLQRSVPLQRPAALYLAAAAASASAVRPAARPSRYAAAARRAQQPAARRRLAARWRVAAPRPACPFALT